jgi:tRNA (guanine-N(7)-)-methyltransferase subunit TRM82
MLLGHVSLLTDLAFVSLPSSTSSSASRHYIITADRDEHIRVSRGPPQAHIIETYCLGHLSFISKICVPPSLPELLISGGGDNYLLVWKWETGELLQKIPLSQDSSPADMAVRGIWTISLGDKDQVTVLVAFEG